MNCNRSVLYHLLEDNRSVVELTVRFFSTDAFPLGHVGVVDLDLVPSPT